MSGKRDDDNTKNNIRQKIAYTHFTQACSLSIH